MGGGGRGGAMIQGQPPGSLQLYYKIIHVTSPANLDKKLTCTCSQSYQNVLSIVDREESILDAGCTTSALCPSPYI